MLTHAVLIGLASTFVWYVIAISDLSRYAGLEPVREKLRPLVGCPWCLGFWLTGAATIATGYDVIAHLAAAAVVGVVGGFAS